jgi:hypothetical protein
MAEQITAKITEALAAGDFDAVARLSAALAALAGDAAGEPASSPGVEAPMSGERRKKGHGKA